MEKTTCLQTRSSKSSKHASILKRESHWSWGFGKTLYPEQPQGFGRKGCARASCTPSKYASKAQRMEVSQKEIALQQSSQRSNWSLLLVSLPWSTKGRCYFWLSVTGLQECFTMRSIRVGGLFNLQGKQAFLIMKLQYNQRKSPEHFTRKCLRFISGKTKISIFFAEPVSAHTALSLRMQPK